LPSRRLSPASLPARIAETGRGLYTERFAHRHLGIQGEHSRGTAEGRQARYVVRLQPAGFPVLEAHACL
jgi:hypothetical protein